MKANNSSVLLIEDDLMHLEMIKTKLVAIGYINIKVCSTYKEGEEVIVQRDIELIVTDFYLDKNKTAVDICLLNVQNNNVPVVVISSFYDQKGFDMIKGFSQIDFLSKSCSEFDLLKSIELMQNEAVKKESSAKFLSFIFVKSGKIIVKLDLSDIQFIEVDGKYLDLHTADNRYTVRMTLNAIDEKLPSYFLKVKQNAIINLNYLTTISMEENTVQLGDREVSFSRSFKKKLLTSFYIN